MAHDRVPGDLVDDGFAHGWGRSSAGSVQLLTMAVEASTSQPQGGAGWRGAERRGMLLAILAVFAFATSPIFVLAAAPLSAFVITCGRMAVGALWVIFLGRLYRQPILPNPADRPLFVGIGLITALHFLSYIASLSFLHRLAELHHHRPIPGHRLHGPHFRRAVLGDAAP
ncbi:MAG: DMT family transporter [Anaerolineae bacterium]|nr:DMT family transporter [Anaerolineae bacterium]